MLLVRGRHDRQGVADGAVAETERRSVGDRRPEERRQAVEALGRQLERAAVARRAQRTARGGIERDETLRRSALDAAADVRQEARTARAA